jgi:hypothetical protein
VCILLWPSRGGVGLGVLNSDGVVFGSGIRRLAWAQWDSVMSVYYTVLSEYYGLVVRYGIMGHCVYD